MGRMTRVALVDDHNLVRKGLVSLVNELVGYEVVLEAANGKQFVDAMQLGHELDIAVVDLGMPVMDGYDTIRWIHQYRPSLKSIALTFDGSEDAAIRALREGARGFLLKTVDPPVFKMALDHVRDGGYFENEMLQRIRQGKETLTSHERLQARMLHVISPRELDFIRFACDPEEYTYDEIAGLMSVASSTVEAHRKRIFERFGIKSKAGLVMFAYRYGIVKVNTR